MNNVFVLSIKEDNKLKIHSVHSEETSAKRYAFRLSIDKEQNEGITIETNIDKVPFINNIK